MKCVTNILDESKLDFQPWGHGQLYACLDATVAKDWGLEKLGFHVEKLNPGCFGCPYHTHLKEEELLIVLEGEATVRQDGEFFQVKKGDLVLFKLGVHHQIYNHTDKHFTFFMLSNKAADDICLYPDSNKIKVGQQGTTQNGVSVDYWKDEEDPRSHWPTEILRKS